MEVFHGIESFRPPEQGVALTVGNFDGVHRGHQRLLTAAREPLNGQRLPVIVMTFEPHPATVLTPQRVPPRLTTPAEKLALLAAFGANAVIVLRSRPELFTLTAGEFLERFVEPCRPAHLVEGSSFRFGRGRAGHVDTLREYARRRGWALTILEEISSPETPGDPPISSSTIRELIRAGRVEHAAAMLGRPHRIVGRVGHGDSRGARLGFPTANLEEIPQLVPGHAVYAAVARLSDGSAHLAVVNVGPQPTFDQHTPRVEAHLLDFSGRLSGQVLGLYFLRRLREQIRFASLGELAAQIGRDIALTREQHPDWRRVLQEPTIPQIPLLSGDVGGKGLV
jgi:riboflavin kinase/FMN adenylyltransferase